MSTLPSVSVIIPMRNESGWIERCVRSALDQDYPSDRLEVLVVDGMSDDGSYETLVEMARRELRVRVFRNSARIVPSSLNIGIEAARGEILARLDAHTLLEPDYIRAGVELLVREGADNVGGPMITIGGGPVGDAIAAAMSSRFGIGAYFHFAADEREVDTVYMGMWPRSVFSRVGLFDEELVRNQDDEFNYRLRKAGGRILVTPAMRSRYQNRQSWRTLAKQFYQYGLWKVRVLQKHPRQMSVRHFVPPAFDLLVLVCLTIPAARPLAGALVVGYLTTMAVVAARMNVPARLRPRVALALAVIHHAWAFGFLVGLLRFSARWFRREPSARYLANGLAGGGSDQ